jgi:FMN-dependent NADH-azoreductase
VTTAAGLSSAMTCPPVTVVGQSFGMTVEVVTVHLTLAPRIPAMAGLRDRSAADAEAARTRAVQLGSTPGG